MNEFVRWWTLPVRMPDAQMRAEALARQQLLTKPPGALGVLEDLVVQLAALQQCARPMVEDVHIAVFVADHGVAAENVSAFPQAVTAQMIDNLAAGGAAISVAARALGATLEVIDLGTVGHSRARRGVRREFIATSSANLAKTAAMNEVQMHSALASGREAAKRAYADGAELFIGGEMGIANTTAASALACALLGLAPAALAGPGTGLDAAGVAHKAAVIERALALHAAHCATPLETLRRLGGFEIAALAGAYIGCAQVGLPALVDGYIATAAALVAVRLQPAAREWLLFAHRSAEPGHAALLNALEAQGLLDLGLRLGEGSGAAVAVPLLRMACALHAGMATFAEAGVATRDS